MKLALTGREGGENGFDAQAYIERRMRDDPPRFLKGTRNRIGRYLNPQS